MKEKNRDINRKKLANNRSRILLDFFFKKHKRIFMICIFSIIFFGALIPAHLLEKSSIWHYVAGSVTVFAFVMVVVSIILAFGIVLRAEELDKIIADDREIAYSGLFDQLAIPNDASKYQDNPIEIVAPEMYPGRNRTLYRYHNKANKIYYSQTGYTWFLFGEDKLFLYHVCVNHVRGFVGFEEASEISYTDIVNVKTSSDHLRNNLEVLNLSLSLINGEKLDFVLRARPARPYLTLDKDSAKEYSNAQKNGELLHVSTSQLSDKEKELVAKIRLAIRKNK